MSTIELTKGKKAIVCDCHAHLVTPFKWCYSPTGYAVRRVGGRKASLTYMHRFITDAPKGMQVDHINGDKLDYRCINLRVCSKAQNMMNRSAQKNSASGIKNVSWDRFGKRWHVQITKNGRRVFSAYTRDLKEAERIQKAQSKLIFGAFAYEGAQA